MHNPDSLIALYNASWRHIILTYISPSFIPPSLSPSFPPFLRLHLCLAPTSLIGATLVPMGSGIQLGPKAPAHLEPARFTLFEYSYTVHATVTPEDQLTVSPASGVS